QAGLAVLVGDDVEHGDRVRVVQPRGDAAFAHHALAGVFRVVFAEPGLQQQLLDGDRAAQDLVVRLPDGPHRARADAAGDAVPIGDQATLVAHATSLWAPTRPGCDPSVLVSRPSARRVHRAYAHLVGSEPAFPRPARDKARRSLCAHVSGTR